MRQSIANALRHVAEIFVSDGILSAKCTQVELDAHEKHAAFRVHRVLIRLHDIGAVFMQKPGYRRHDARHDPGQEISMRARFVAVVLRFWMRRL